MRGALESLAVGTLGKGEVRSSILRGGTTQNPHKIGLFCYNRRSPTRPHCGQILHERGQNMTADWGIRWGKMFMSRASRPTGD